MSSCHTCGCPDEDAHFHRTGGHVCTIPAELWEAVERLSNWADGTCGYLSDMSPLLQDELRGDFIVDGEIDAGRNLAATVRRVQGEQVSYDIKLCEPVGGEVINFEHPPLVAGGTFAVGGTPEAWLNVTYNYSKQFYRVMGEKGIRSIYGKTGAETIPILEAAIAALGDDTNPDYWKPTDGNAKKALLGLLAFARLRPDGVWDGD